MLHIKNRGARCLKDYACYVHFTIDVTGIRQEVTVFSTSLKMKASVQKVCVFWMPCPQAAH